MAVTRRKLNPGETVIGFVRPDGSLIGQFADPAVGHQSLAFRYPGLLTKLKTGHAIAITIGKRPDGTIMVFGSGHFPPPGGMPLSASFKALVEKLVE